MARLQSSIHSVLVAWLLFAVTIQSSAIHRRHDGAFDFEFESNSENAGELVARANCRTITVKAGDGCASLVKRCKISAANFNKFNKNSKLCSTLQPGQKVCCSSGTLPSKAPKPNKDGSCASYTIKSGDTCSAIAGTRDLTPAKVESFNKKTWAWGGCNALIPGNKMCLSTGTAPMPTTKTGYECGPQKPGTKKPAAGVNIATLNPCPLNACCSAWGQCGIGPDTCTDTNTGAPGTFKPGTNGCISNCGTKIVSSSTAAKPFRKVGYFQGYNLYRPCANMDASQIDTKGYTHLNFAFATLSSDYKVVIPDDAYTQYEFKSFKALSGPSRVLTIGGWDFSTNPSTYMIFRNGVKQANALQLAKNIAAFIKQNGLDGVDIDWEYPGAPDIPGIPKGSSDEGKNFATFLKTLKGQLGSKSLSVAVPATYYYAKAFPLKDISAATDYINFMTYDLHGTGDLSSSAGCPSGKCLRSPINATEINYAFSMITKAGVASNKVAVGVTSYGRSYKMSKAGCTGPTCTWNGSPASGRCTQESGFLSDAEIKEIALTNPTAKKIHDAPSNTDILVYNSTQWVGYMAATNRQTQVKGLESLKFGGWVDWAIDFEDFHPSPASANSPRGQWESDWQDFKDAVAAGEDPLGT